VLFRSRVTQGRPACSLPRNPAYHRTLVRNLVSSKSYLPSSRRDDRVLPSTSVLGGAACPVPPGQTAPVIVGRATKQGGRVRARNPTAGGRGGEESRRGPGGDSKRSRNHRVAPLTAAVSHLALASSTAKPRGQLLHQGSESDRDARRMGVPVALQSDQIALGAVRASSSSMRKRTAHFVSATGLAVCTPSAPASGRDATPSVSVGVLLFLNILLLLCV